MPDSKIYESSTKASDSKEILVALLCCVYNETKFIFKGIRAFRLRERQRRNHLEFLKQSQTTAVVSAQHQ